MHFPQMHLGGISLTALPLLSFPDVIAQNLLLFMAPFRSSILYLAHFHYGSSCTLRGPREDVCGGESTHSLLIVSTLLFLCTLKVYRFCKVFKMYKSHVFFLLKKFISGNIRLKLSYLLCRLLGEMGK